MPETDRKPMRQICEIAVAVQESAPATEEELRLALICYAMSASGFMRFLSELMDVVDDPARLQSKIRFLAKGKIGSYWMMVKLPPDQYLGPEHTPGTPEFRAGLEMAKRVFKKATGVDLDAKGN